MNNARTKTSKLKRSSAKHREVEPLGRFHNTKTFEALSDAEKEQVAALFESGEATVQPRPLSAAERRKWEQIRRKPGRPKVGGGAKPISLSVEGGLLRRADALASKMGVSRSQLVALGLERVLADSGVAARR